MENKNPENSEIIERDATLDDDLMDETMDEEKVRETILEDSGMSEFQKFIARLDDKKWKVYQWIFGGILGVAAAVALFWPSLSGAEAEQNSGAFSWPLIIAIVLALTVPNIVERKTLRKMPAARVALAVVLGVCLVAFFLIKGITTGFRFKA